MPRSRTAWLSRLLTYREWQCGHDEVRHLRSLDDLASWFSQPCTGTIETACAPFWRLLERFGDVGVVVVRRPVSEVVASFRAAAPGYFDGPAIETAMHRLAHKLDQIERRLPGVLTVTFEELGTEAGCRKLWEHCLPYPFDAAWHGVLAPVNIQVSLGLLFRYMAAYKPQLTKLAKQVKHVTLAGMAREVGEIDGVTFQQEPFEQWYRDGRALFEAHLVRVGEAPDNYAFKNLPLLRTLDAAGALQITTARMNGRMFGYLATLVGPSLESVEGTWGTNTFFYASPEMRGLGMKLQRASIAALRERGVGEVFMLAGPRGEGPRMSSLYRRLGGEDCGQFFRMRLEN
jgi:hypothetical protein